MARAQDTLVHLGYHAGFEDCLRASRRVMMAYLWAFPFLGVLYFASGATFSGAPLTWLLVLVVSVLLLLTIARSVIKVELVLDRERQQLLLRRRIFFFVQLQSLAGVEELWAVVTAGEVPAAPVNYWWDYVTLIITKSGQRFRAARHGEKFDLAQAATRTLGQDLGVEVLESYEGHRVKVVPGTLHPEVQFKKYPLKALDCLTVFFWGFSVFLTPVLSLALLFK